MNLALISKISILSYTSLAIAFLFSFLLSALLGQDALGEYGAFLSASSIFISILSLGSEKPISKYAAKNQDFALSIFYSSICYYFIFFILTSIVYFLIISINIEEVTSISSIYYFSFMFAAACVPVRLTQRISRANGKPLVPIVVDILFLKIMPYILFLWMGFSYHETHTGISEIYLLHIVFSILGAIYIIYSNKSYLFVNNISQRIWPLYLHLKRIMVFWMTNIMNVIQKEIDTLIVLYFFGPAIAGSVFLARRWYNALSMLNDSFAIAFEHEFSLAGQKKFTLYKKIRKVTVLASSILVFFSLPVFAILEFYFRIIDGVFILILIFGVQRVVENSVGPIFMYLSMQGREKKVFENIFKTFILKVGVYLAASYFSLSIYEIIFLICSGTVILTYILFRREYNA